ncbi:MAG: carboxypeptidase-like regulatory domain-containing protein, partial [Bacteroidia bacterium]|nr:carboxypeptidase-like regulatory domain-containing protein [Bacteroidia bacterium]
MHFDKSIILLCTIFCLNLNAQSSYTINGLIQDSEGSPMAYSNVLLLNASDSTLVKGTLAKDDGTFVLDDVNSGNYMVQGSMIGYQSKNSNPFSLNSDYKVETIVLSSFEALDEVVLVAKKQLYEQKVDRMVINVESSIVSSGSTALEILERSPGVLVNRQSNAISLSGKEGVVMMINGKISYVPVSSLVQILEGMSADNIESIELITTP